MSSVVGSSKRRPASRIFAFARTSLWPIDAGSTRKAAAIREASSPSTVCSISGVRTAASIAGWAQTNSSLRRSSGNAPASGAASSCSSARSIDAASATPRWAGRVAQGVARSGQQPGVRVGRHAALGPGAQRGDEGVRQRVFGGRDVACSGRQHREQPPVRRARRRLRRAARLVHRQAAGDAIGGNTGLTSTDATSADGARAAQSSAVSRSGTSITK